MQVQIIFLEFLLFI